MSAPRTYQTEAIIIKKTKLGEADSILTFYTPGMGKIQGFARSLRKPRSRLAGHLELLTHSQVSFAKGRNLDTITGGQTIDGFLPIRDDLWLTSCALYTAELVSQFTPEHVADEPLFLLLMGVLKLLPQVANKELLLRHFELHLLGEVGYRPQLRECVKCHAPLEPVVNAFCPGLGGMLCPDCAAGQYVAYPMSLNAQKVLRLLQGNDYAPADQLNINTELAAEMERVMARYLTYLLERDVKSAGWLSELREQRMVFKPGAIKSSTPPPQTSPPVSPSPSQGEGE